VDDADVNFDRWIGNKSSTYPTATRNRRLCCLILAWPFIFVIAMDAVLLISYANGQVAGTLDIFILRTAFIAAEAHF
jgi:hypothetical protein